MSKTTTYLQNFLNDIGNSVHSLNSIAVSLSNINTNTTPSDGLNITWNIGNTQATKEMSRNFAIRAAVVYAVETFYEYLRTISNSVLWTDTEKLFSEIEGDSKAIKAYNFLIGIDNIEEEWPLLVELLGHWRNKAVHSYTSNAKLSSKKRQMVLQHKKKIEEELRSFNIEIAIDNFNNNKYTLKDASTLITVTIKCARAVEMYYLSKLPDTPKAEEYIEIFKKDEIFLKILSQQESKKKTRQINKWLEINYSDVTDDTLDLILEKLKIY